ncbi:MAG: helix-turn-helix domain-containing protein [Actinomycetia bacterium]|nr:helix-turn-helix domain-containing protein [Actinomycetes bacterium]
MPIEQQMMLSEQLEALGMDKQSDLITSREAAGMIKVSHKTWINWRSARRPGMPVGFRPAGGRQVLYRRADVERWIEQQIRDAADIYGGGAA